MSNVEERLRQTGRDLRQEVDEVGVLGRIGRRAARRRLAHRAGTAALILSVVAGVAAGTIGLARVFRTAGRHPAALPANGPFVFSAVERTLLAPNVHATPAIYLVNPDGTGLRVVPGTAGGTGPEWSPDGEEIAFVGSGSVVVSSPVGGQRNPFKGAAGAVSWAPDGRRIAYTSGYDISIYDPAQRDPSLLTHFGGGTITAGNLAARDPAWSPDGRWILFARFPLVQVTLFVERGCRLNQGNGIFEISPRGGTPRRLTDGCDSAPAWSPDGRRVAFVRDPSPGSEAGVYVLEVSSGRLRRVSRCSAAPAGGPCGLSTPAWSPNGSEIALVRDGAILVMNADGSGVHQVPELGSLVVSSISWGPKVSTPPASPAGSVIPWITATPAPSPSPRVAPLTTARPCAASDLKGEGGQFDGATGSAAGGFGFTNVSSSPCSLRGRPGIEILSESGTPLPVRGPSVPTPTHGHGAGGVVISPGEQAEVIVVWSNWCGSWPASERFLLRFTLPDRGGVLTVPFTSFKPRCDSPTSRSTVGVMPFGLQTPPSPSEAAPPLRVDMHLPEQAVAGQALDYTITLTNTSKKPFAFGPCPAYREQIGPEIGSGWSETRIYLLNCGPVGSIGPGESVTLAMVIDVPAEASAGLGEVVWILQPLEVPVPGSSPAPGPGGKAQVSVVAL